MDFAKFAQWWAQVSSVELAWLVFGFAAQGMFFMRFVIQWIASERVKRSIVPETFWYFSFAGGVMLFVYAVHRADPVIMLGQLMGLVIYSRNIYLIWFNKRIDAANGAVKASPASTNPAPGKNTLARNRRRYSRLRHAHARLKAAE